MPNPLSRLLRSSRGDVRRSVLWLAPQLAQSASFAPEEAPRLISMGIDSVLNLQEQAGPEREALQRLGIRYLHLPMAEFEPPTVEQLEEGARVAVAEIARGRSVLVYCRLGQSRSVCMACAILVALGHPLVSALDQYRKAGRGALSGQQMECLGQFEARLRAGESVGPERLSP